MGKCLENIILDPEEANCKTNNKNVLKEEAAFIENHWYSASKKHAEKHKSKKNKQSERHPENNHLSNASESK